MKKRGARYRKLAAEGWKLRGKLLSLLLMFAMVGSILPVGALAQPAQQGAESEASADAGAPQQDSDNEAPPPPRHF
jgi:hypothetical protein